jgi:hypothetical protein
LVARKRDRTSGSFDSERAAEAARKRWEQVGVDDGLAAGVVAGASDEDLRELLPLLVADLKKQAKAGSVPPGQAITLVREALRMDEERQKREAERDPAARDRKEREGEASLLDDLERWEREGSWPVSRLLELLEGKEGYEGYLAGQEASMKRVRALHERLKAKVA